MNQQNILNAEQSAIVAELTLTYGIEPEEIIFFEKDPKPFLTYEANSVMCNHLTNLTHIGVEPVPSVFPESVAVKCTIITQNGNERTAVGVANLGEQIDDKLITQPQAMNLANARALRSVLRAAGIDLMKLHQAVIAGANVMDFKVKTNLTALLAQAHILGKQAGLIVYDNKQLWYQVLSNRYGVETSGDLSEEHLADFVAFLKTLVPSQTAAA